MNKSPENMACTNSTSDANNRFLEGSDSSLPTLTVAYGPYMNWGRWNHNTSRIKVLVELLQEEGYAVQLNHEEKEEGDGWVEISLDGVVLSRSDDVQHNRNWSSREALQERIANEAIEKYTTRTAKSV